MRQEYESVVNEREKKGMDDALFVTNVCFREEYTHPLFALHLPSSSLYFYNK
jgi:hypothetical protein